MSDVRALERCEVLSALHSLIAPAVLTHRSPDGDAIGSAVADYGDAEHQRCVLKAFPCHTGHGTGHGHAHNLTDATVLVDPGCAVGVGIVGLAGNHNGGLVVTAAWHVTRFLATNHLCEVFLSAEQNLDVFMQAASTIEAGVYDDAVAVVVFSENVGIDSAETGVAH